MLTITPPCLLLTLALVSGVPSLTQAQADPTAAHRQLARGILEQLIAINTTDSAGNTPQAAQAMAARLLAAGFPTSDVTVLGPDQRLGNLVARFRGRGSGKRPILLMAHLDVVEARREDWSVDPFTFLEQDGYFYGRGSADNKAGVAILVANFIRYHQEGFVPDRDLILLLTADEETTGASIEWLLRSHRDLVDADYALNTDAGDPILKGGRRVMFVVQASEKVYLSFRLEVTDNGGHSSRPTKENAIYRLAQGLVRLAAFEFPVTLNEVTRAFFERSAAIDTGQVARDMHAIAGTPPDPAAATRLAASPYYNAMMRTTCVATRLDGGHADNALPQAARAVVNCRILPGESPAEVERTLRRVLADERIAVTPIGSAVASPPSPLRPDVMQAIGRLVAAQFPGVPVVPEMATGASDGLFTRNAGIPTYGVSALFQDPDDVRWHARDERISVEVFYDALEFWYRMVKTLAGAR